VTLLFPESEALFEASWFACHIIIAAWKCFDKHAGYWLGLDTPKYQRYIDIRERTLRMEEHEAMHGEEATKQSEKVSGLHLGSSQCKP